MWRVSTYQATNLTDTVPGQDQWQYHYQIDGSFNDSVHSNRLRLLGRNHRRGRELVHPANSAWPFLGSRQHLLSNSVSRLSTQMSAAFDLTFVWQVAGAPSAQNIEISILPSVLLRQS